MFEEIWCDDKNAPNNNNFNKVLNEISVRRKELLSLALHTSGTNPPDTRKSLRDGRDYFKELLGKLSYVQFNGVLDPEAEKYLKKFNKYFTLENAIKLAKEQLTNEKEDIIIQV